MDTVRVAKGGINISLSLKSVAPNPCFFNVIIIRKVGKEGGAQVFIFVSHSVIYGQFDLGVIILD